MLRKYHYLDTNLSSAAICYGLYDNEALIGFCAVTHFPHPKNPKIKHIHRLVIHPDYQGIGLGKKLLNFVAKIWSDNNFNVNIIISAKNLIMGLNRDSHWSVIHYGKFRYSNVTSDPRLRKSSSEDRITASFKFVNRERKDNGK